MSKKTVQVAMAVLFLLNISTLVFNIQSARAEPRTWTVDDDGPADFHIIQEAVDAAGNGDSIHVYSGTYYENLVIDGPLTLVGEDKQSTIIDGNRSGTVIQVAATNVVISGFTIQNSGSESGALFAGVWISRPTNLTGNHITGNRVGIYVSSFKSNIIKNRVTNNGHGISLSDSSEVTVEANNFTANTMGISLTRSFNNMIVGNNVTRSSPGGHGICLSSGSSNNTVKGNRFVDNSHGMWLSGSANNTILENTIARNKLLGIELTDSRDNIIYHNNFVENTKQVVVSQPNTWDDGYPSGGNYWGDYEERYPDAEEIDDSGIWNTPYVINENNVDRHPSVRSHGDISDIIPDKTKPTAKVGPDQRVRLGTPVHFDASGSTGNIVSFEWDFGDGTSGTGVTCSHIYNKTGAYTVALTVKDAEGNSDTDLATVTVVPVEAFPFWINPTAVAIVIAIAATLFWKLKVSKKTKKKRIRKLRARAKVFSMR